MTDLFTSDNSHSWFESALTAVYTVLYEVVVGCEAVVGQPVAPLTRQRHYAT